MIESRRRRADYAQYRLFLGMSIRGMYLSERGTYRNRSGREKKIDVSPRSEDPLD